MLCAKTPHRMPVSWSGALEGPRHHLCYLCALAFRVFFILFCILGGGLCAHSRGGVKGERETEGKERERESQVGPMFSMEPSAGLYLATVRSRPEPK